MPREATETTSLLMNHRLNSGEIHHLNSDVIHRLNSVVIHIDGSEEDGLEITETGPSAMTRQEKVNAALKLITSPLTGAGSAYSTFGTIAMLYYPGLWLLAPVGSGSVISISDAALSILIKKHPESPLLNKLQTGFKVANRMIVGYLADFGFSWNLIKTTAIFAGGKDYAGNSFAKITAPILSVLPAGLVRYIHYRQATGRLTERSIPRHVASFIRGANSTSAIMGTLMIQGILDVDSVIPTATYSVMGTLALAASLCQERYPTASKSIMAMINILAENASLSVLSFALLNDVYAAVNDWDVSYAFFDANAAINIIYYLILTSMTLSMLFTPQQQEHIEELELDSDSSFSYDEDTDYAEAASSSDTAISIMDEEANQPQTLERRNSFHDFGVFSQSAANTESTPENHSSRRHSIS